MWTEFFCLFIILPFLFFFRKLNIPLLAALSIATVFCLVILYLSDGEFKIKLKPVPKDLKFVLAKFAIASLTLGLIVYFFLPERFFFFPKNHLFIWLLVLILYPFLSVFPQEIIYRVFFFHRYRAIFANKFLLIFINAICFAILHIVFRNWQSVVLTFLGSFLFAYNFERNKSLFWVSFEHYIYGIMIFTIGLGQYFYGATFN